MHALARQYRAFTIALVFCALAFAATSTAAQTVIATVPVGKQPASLDVNTTTNKIYVSNIATNNTSISVIDGATNTVTSTITNIGANIYDLAVNSVTNKIYVTGSFSSNVTVIDGATNGVIKVIPTGGFPWRIAINPVTNRIYVADANSSTLIVLDGASDSIITSIPLPSGAAYAPAVNTATNKIYVVNGTNSVNVINGATNTITGTIPVGSGPQRIGVNPATNRIYTANYNSSNVSVIDGATDTVITTIPTSGHPFGIGIDKATGKIIVPNQLNEASATTDPTDVISGASNTVVATFTVGDQPSSVAVNPFTRRAYISNQINNGTVSVIALPNDVLISEFRFHGAAGGADEFVEIANAGTGGLVVGGADDSAGWSLVGSDGAVRANIPNGTVIPGGGHLLVVNSNGYSLTSAGGGAAGDLPYTQDIPDDSGVALFMTQNTANLNGGTRFDAVGFNNAAGLLYREGAGIASFPTVDGEYSFLRRLNGGTPQDTGDNASDFILVATAPLVVGSGATLGAPGPENLASPVLRNATVKGMQLDPCNGAGVCVNRVRSGALAPEFTGSHFGTFRIRRAFKNSTTRNITRLRFRVTDVSQGAAAGEADLRVLRNSGGSTVTLSNGQEALLAEMTRELPDQTANGGGINTTLLVTLAQPLIAGATINVEFNFAVVRDGNFRFFVNVEALTSAANIAGGAGQSNAKITSAMKGASGRKQK